MAKANGTQRDRELAAAAARQGARIQARIDKKPPPTAAKSQTGPVQAGMREYPAMTAPACSSYITGEILPVIGGYSGS